MNRRRKSQPQPLEEATSVDDQWPESLKDGVIKIIGALPDDVTVAEIVEALDFVIGIEVAITDVEAGRVISHDEMLRTIESWKRQP